MAVRAATAKADVNPAASAAGTARSHRRSLEAKPTWRVRQAFAQKRTTVPMPQINLFFDVLPPKVGVNGQALLRWRTTNATSCVLDPGNEELALSGSRSVTVGQTTFFTITARNEDDIQQQQVLVEVDPELDPNVVPRDLANAVASAASD